MYLGSMKTRLVLTMDAKRVAKLRALSRRRKISVAALVEDLTALSRLRRRRC